LAAVVLVEQAAALREAVVPTHNLGSSRRLSVAVAVLRQTLLIPDFLAVLVVGLAQVAQAEQGLLVRAIMVEMEITALLGAMAAAVALVHLVVMRKR
jgi:hypothetical protein